MHFLVLTLLLLGSSLYATNLTELINSSLANNPSLDAITARIKASEANIYIAKQFANPELSLTTNTLDNSQAMSKTLLSIKQNIPYFNKRSTREQVALADKSLKEEQLNTAKVALVAKIKKEAYTIWQLQELTKIINNYITLTKHNIDIYESYATTNENQHLGIIKAELSLADFTIEKSTLDAKMDAAYARLSYLSALKVTHLEITLTITHKPELQQLQDSLQNNPTIALKEKELKKQNAAVTLSALEKYPDLNLISGYAHRENFEDYFNIGIAFSLPIYGRENAKEEEARAMQLSYASQKMDATNSVNALFKAYYAQMQSAYNIYHIVQDDALPQIIHMFDLSNASISTSGDLFKYIDVLFQKFSLEQKSINAVASYHQAKAKISELAGALK